MYKMTDLNNNLINTDSKLPCAYESKKFIDIHCHCLADMDDGPSGIFQSISLFKELVRENIFAVIATPHQLGSYDGLNEAQTIRDAVKKHNEILKQEGIPINVFPGGEVRVDERICRLLKDDKILTLADSGKYILLELPHLVFIDIEPILIELVSMNIVPIIAHAERVDALIKNPNILSKWLKHSILLQITAQSVGLGSCWVQIRNRMHSDSITAEKYVQELLNIPGHFRVSTIIAVGYPEKTREGKPFEELQFEKIRINKF